MHKLRLKSLACLLLGLFIAPACKKKTTASNTTKVSAAQAGTQKKVSVFDGDIEAFVVDEDESAFGPQEGFALIDESENDMVV